MPDYFDGPDKQLFAESITFRYLSEIYFGVRRARKVADYLNFVAKRSKVTLTLCPKSLKTTLTL